VQAEIGVGAGGWYPATLEALSAVGR